MYIGIAWYTRQDGIDLFAEDAITLMRSWGFQLGGFVMTGSDGRRPSQQFIYYPVTGVSRDEIVSCLKQIKSRLKKIRLFLEKQSFEKRQAFLVIKEGEGGDRDFVHLSDWIYDKRIEFPRSPHT